MRGGGGEIINAYRDAGVIYAAVSDQRVQLLKNNGLFFIKTSVVALTMSGIVITCLFCLSIIAKFQLRFGRIAFWLGISLVPLIEPVSKMACPYHFAVCLPGLVGLFAVGWRILAECAQNLIHWMVLISMIGVLVLAPTIIKLTNDWPSTSEALHYIRTGNWSANAIAQSNYLLAAEEIRKIAPPNATLSVSGFMYTLYPLTGLLPPSDALSNLSASLIKYKFDGERLTQALLACPPDVVMTTSRKDWPGAATLTVAVIGSGQYKPIAIIPESLDKSYGMFGGTVYLRSHEDLITHRDHTSPASSFSRP